MGNKSPHIKTLIIEDTPQEKNLTQSAFLLALVPREDGVGHESVKISEGGVANRFTEVALEPLVLYAT